MKKFAFIFAAVCLSATANAQVDIDMSKFFTIPEKTVDILEPNTHQDGIVFIGDTRPDEKKADGQYKGMRAQLQKRCYQIDGKVRQYTTALSFRRTPWGAAKDHVIQLEAVPRSCMLQLKPTTGGKFTFCLNTSKPEAKLYIGVRNGNTYKNLTVLTWEKGEVKGNKAEPFMPVTYDYTYTEGDEIWIYSDGTANLLGFLYTGKIDKDFTGSEPVSIAKAVSRERKKNGQ